jgi:hypothetical protein
MFDTYPVTESAIEIDRGQKNRNPLQISTSAPQALRSARGRRGAIIGLIRDRTGTFPRKIEEEIDDAVDDEIHHSG